MNGNDFLILSDVKCYTRNQISRKASLYDGFQSCMPVTAGMSYFKAVRKVIWFEAGTNREMTTVYQVPHI